MNDKQLIIGLYNFIQQYKKEYEASWLLDLITFDEFVEFIILHSSSDLGELKIR
jgi:hypothetical protein